MSNQTEKISFFVSLMLILSIASLFLENSLYRSTSIRIFTNILDYIVLLLFILDIATGFIRAKYKLIYLRRNIFEILFLLVFAVFFVFHKYVGFMIQRQMLRDLSIYIIILRNLFVLIKVFARVKKFNTLMWNIAKHPAQTVLFSFFVVIIIGTLFLMMPFTTSDNTRLGLVDSLFTATSAVCVTGLIVVDTATRFSILGKIIILLLIQIGGLGIMILSFFMLFIFGRRVSVERKLAMSYLLNEQDMTILYGSIKSIIMTTFFIEMGGVLLLYIAFGRIFGVTLNSLSLAVFHAVSAFCNAGFSLFSESLSGYTSDILINITIAFLIILGGISFSVLSNVINVSMYRLGKNIRRRPHIRHLSLNSKVVLIVSIILIFSGTLIIYAFEHGNSLLEYGIGTQYLAAFFQSVTLRTAGFNSIDFTSLNRSSYLLMILFMFIGGASGSTAGGVKVNTVGLVSGYVKSIVKGSDDVILFNQSVPKEQINRAFFIIFLYVVLIFIATMILTITENFATVPILFEVVSAIGTVGLSTGVTPHLTTGGKIAIILLMFIGRVGPLTVVVSLQGRRKVLPVIYPKGTIAIG